jgi:phenylacetate-CoA ligase
VPEHYDKLETRSPEARERALMKRFREELQIYSRRRGFRAHLKGVDVASIRSRADLARIPVLRKAALKDMQASDVPFGGLASASLRDVGRLFMSPGPVFEPEGTAADFWGMARAFFAAGFRKGDVVLNTFSYNLTPGGFILDSGARALGCPVIPAGPGNREAQLDLIQQFRPAGYAGTPDFLKLLMDAADEAKRPWTITKAIVSGAALPPSLRATLEGRGMVVRQSYATADVGAIAFETSDPDGRLVPGMVLNEGLVVEIVRPGTDQPVPDGEVGEVVVTRLDPVYPLLRLGTGDLSAILSGPSPCGRTNRRIKGWMGRADQRTKVKGMFVDPAQIDAVARRHPEIARARLVVTRADEQDEMVLHVEAAEETRDLAHLIADTLAAVTKLKGTVRLVPPGSLPNDGKVIADERPVG